MAMDKYINEADELLRHALHYLETPGDFTEDDRLNLIHDIAHHLLYDQVIEEEN